jgi:hypothetical protein
MEGVDQTLVAEYTDKCTMGICSFFFDNLLFIFHLHWQINCFQQYIHSCLNGKTINQNKILLGQDRRYNNTNGEYYCQTQLY